MKPQKARNYDRAKTPPVAIIQPKYDGVRGGHWNGQFSGRSLKLFRNTLVNSIFQRPELAGFDGELCVGPPDSPTLCADTSGGLSTGVYKPGHKKHGVAERTADLVQWHVFDLHREDTLLIPYRQRYEMLGNLVASLGDSRIIMMPKWHTNTWGQIDELNSHFLDLNYEGTIGRNGDALPKEDYAGTKLWELWRIKGFVDFEFLIKKVNEGDKNNNEPTINELGQTTRSSHQENKVPNGMIGTLEGPLLADVRDPHTDALLLAKGTWVLVSAGQMKHADRKHLFEHPEEILEKIGKAKLFPKGHKDKPRFPIFLSIRMPEDMS